MKTMFFLAIFGVVWGQLVAAPEAGRAAASVESVLTHDPEDQTIWPNQTSRANGDRWLVENHDRIRQMRPRVLLVNFSNEHDEAHLEQLVTRLRVAVAESSRYHGYANAEAPVFLQYEIFKIDSYVCTGGNAHFPPNGRRHYDLDNTAPVLSTIEDWRIGSGPEGRDVAKPFTNAAFSQYREMAPDCMGPWLVYWRQNMPGLDNRQKDADGRPMKNWWPFLFY